MLKTQLGSKIGVLGPEWQEQVRQLEAIRGSDQPTGPSFTTGPVDERRP